MPRLEVPRRFYVQLERDDLHMLLIPRSFHASLKEWMMIPLPRCIAIDAYKFWDEHVQLQYYKNTGEIVIGRNWPDVVHSYNLEEDDVLVFKLTATGFKMDIYKNMDSTARGYTCPEHG